jgi:hypothetical protein
LPRYFLHKRAGARLTADPEGEDFPDLQASRLAALASAREFISRSVLNGERLGLDRQFEIADANGKVLLIVPFRDAVQFDEDR